MKVSGQSNCSISVTDVVLLTEMPSRKTFVTIKKNKSWKYHHSVDRETVEADVERNKGTEAANVTIGVPVKVSKHTENCNH